MSEEIWGKDYLAVEKFISTPSGLAFVISFLSIRDTATRDMIIQMVASFAEAEREMTKPT